MWSRFRQSAHAMCFYEPFHETLARCTPKRIRRDTHRSWNSRHPALDQPYRQEYLPFIRLRGMPGYHDEFAVARYFPSADGIEPELKYLRRLLNQATRAGKSAVLGFSRSLARSAAIKRALGGYHIVIQRDPLQQWLSCRSYRVNEASIYFELCHFLILALASPDSPAGRFAQHVGLPRPPRGHFRKQYEFLQAALHPWSDELSYRVFLAVHALSHEAAHAAADLTVDMDRLNTDEAYRNRIRGTIFGRTGFTLNFDDSHVGKHDVNHLPIDVVAVERDALRVLRQCQSSGSSNTEPEDQGEFEGLVARQPTT